MKLREFQSYLKKEKITLTFLTAPDSGITYFTHMEPSHGHLIVSARKASLFVTKLDRKPRLKDISTVVMEKGWEKSVTSKKQMNVGINKDVLTLRQFEKIKKLFPKAKFVDVSKKLHELRLVKTPTELRNMRKACDITSSAFRALVRELPKKKLKTEQDVALFLEAKIRAAGAILAFPTIAAVGKNAAVPHHITSTERLKRGFLLVDFGARYKHYCADMTRVLFLGKPTDTERKWYYLLLKSQEAAIAAVHDGISYKKLDTISRDVLGAYAKRFVHSLGHGIGLEVHENPVFSEEGVEIIRNVPFTIEPGIYFPGKFGLRIEDTVVWDGRRTQILTSAPKKLIFVTY